jgi:hypothetical protein
MVIPGYPPITLTKHLQRSSWVYSRRNDHKKWGWVKPRVSVAIWGCLIHPPTILICKAGCQGVTFFHQGARLLTGGNLGNLEIPTIYIPIACDIRIGIESTGDHSSHQKELEPKCVGR